VTVQLPEGSDAEAIRAEAARRRIMLNSMSDYRADSPAGSTTLMIGYGSVPEPAITPGVRELAAVARAVFASSSAG
jgi:DNA-binding transcriptional MocR family regulator